MNFCINLIYEQSRRPVGQPGSQAASQSRQVKATWPISQQGSRDRKTNTDWISFLGFTLAPRSAIRTGHKWSCLPPAA